MDLRRLKILDFAVLGTFALSVVGVSLTWWKVDAVISGPEGYQRPWENYTYFFSSERGWNFSLGVLAFIVALVAAVVVTSKVFLAAGGPLPSWYREGLVTMGLSGLSALLAAIRVAAEPAHGSGESLGRGTGGFITLVAGLLMVGCGYLMSRDRRGAYGGQPARSALGD